MGRGTARLARRYAAPAEAPARAPPCPSPRLAALQRPPAPPAHYTAAATSVELALTASDQKGGKLLCISVTARRARPRRPARAAPSPHLARLRPHAPGRHRAGHHRGLRRRDGRGAAPPRRAGLRRSVPGGPGGRGPARLVPRLPASTAGRLRPRSRLGLERTRLETQTASGGARGGACAVGPVTGVSAALAPRRGAPHRPRHSASARRRRPGGCF